MSWTDRFLPGSFNGIPFQIESHDYSAGRHSKEHEPPDRNSGFSEDIGKQIPKYSIEAYVLGDNYFFNRDALINLLESQTVGLLVHPYLGFKTVQPKSFSVRESSKEGRIARFTIEFVEKGNPFFPFSTIDAIVDFVTSAVAVVLQVQTAFTSIYSIANLPAFTLDSAEQMLKDFCSTVVDGIGNVRVSREEQADTIRRCEKIDVDTPTLVRGDPALIASRIDEMIVGLKDIVPDPPDNATIDSTSGRDDKLSVFNPLIRFRGVADSILPNTPTRSQEYANANAIADLVQQLAIIRLGEQIVDKVFKSNDEAQSARAIVTDAIDSQLELDRISDESFQGLEDIKAKIVAAVPNAASNLSNIREIEKTDTIPSLVLAYDLYEGLTTDQVLENERDIIDRNKIRKPQFVSGQLQVLTIGTGG